MESVVVCTTAKVPPVGNGTTEFQLDASSQPVGPSPNVRKQTRGMLLLVKVRQAQPNNPTVMEINQGLVPRTVSETSNLGIRRVWPFKHSTARRPQPSASPNVETCQLHNRTQRSCVTHAYETSFATFFPLPSAYFQGDQSRVQPFRDPKIAQEAW